MSDIVERLHEHDWQLGRSLAYEAAAEIERLRAENASLSTWQCEFTDGKTGLVYGQGGTTFCIMAKRMQQLEAEAKTRTLDYLGQVGQLSEELERLRADRQEILEQAQKAVIARDVEIDRLRTALRGAEAWLQNWAVHAGRCEGGNGCTCGLTAIRYDLSTALEERT